jgi:hypothetical protein
VGDTAEVRPVHRQRRWPSVALMRAPISSVDRSRGASGGARARRLRELKRVPATRLSAAAGAELPASSAPAGRLKPPSPRPTMFTAPDRPDDTSTPSRPRQRRGLAVGAGAKFRLDRPWARRRESRTGGKSICRPARAAAHEYGRRAPGSPRLTEARWLILRHRA